jgi:hypothetical protein
LRIPQVLFRIGICITIIGLSIFLANLTSTIRGSTSHGNFETPANGADILFRELKNRPYEIRILVPQDFNGTFNIFNYHGIKKFTEGTKTPILQQNIRGSALIDFTPNRRGAYMFLIENETPTATKGSISLVEKEALSQDLLTDSTIIIVFGLTITLATAAIKSLKHRILT